MEPTRPPRRRRLRFLLWTLISFTALVLAGAAILFWWTSSPGFEAWVSRRLQSKLEQAIGGRVEVRAFHWRPFRLEGEAGGIVIHGLEAPGDVPFAQVERVRAQLSILDFLSPRILLRDLEVTRPSIHLIVYPNGSTNQPHPRRPVKSKRSTLDTVLDLEAGRIAVEQGVFDFEDRASEFDFQDRLEPLDFAASDVSLHMNYVSAVKGRGESYHVEAGARDLRILRGRPPRAQEVHAYTQATLDLTRSAVFIRSLRLTSRPAPASGSQKEHSLAISGELDDFSHPHWKGRVAGELDLRLVDPVTGFPRTPQGLARVDLSVAGSMDQFRADGSLHVEDGSYIGNGVNATGFTLDGQLHADPVQLLVRSAVLRFRQGGRMEGTIALSPWLGPLPAAPALERGGQAGVRAVPGSVAPARLQSPDEGVPMNGKVMANLKAVPLDAILDIVGQNSLPRIGFDSILDGPATGTWSNGDDRTIEIDAKLNLSPGYHPEPGEVPASGILDATYSNKIHSIDLRRLELHTPSSAVEAHGAMGVHPVSGPSSMNVDFHSHNLADFDILLRTIGLERHGKTGVAALPAALSGQADFHGTWNGSLIDPHIAGSASATDLAIEMPATPSGKAGEPQWVHWDSIAGDGSYSAERIDIAHGVLRRGSAEIALSGDLIAAPASLPAGRVAAMRVFTRDSTLRLRLHAANVSTADLLPLAGSELPVTGTIDTQLTLDGAIRSLGGSGWAELKDGSIYGQPVTRIHAQGSLARKVVKVASAQIQEAGGTIQAQGEIQLDSKEFTVDSRGSGIDLAQIEALGRHGLAATGKLSFTLAGSGSLDDPHLEGRASFSDLELDGEPLGPLEVKATAAGRVAAYSANTSLESATITLQGQTALTGGFATKAQLEFSSFNIATLFKMAHLESLGGQSALAGTIALEGPLAHPDELRGEARLKELAVTVAGVHLKSDNGLHATLAGDKVSFDPLHVTGEETDMHMEGSLALNGRQQLDFASSGTINLKLGQMLDPDLTASGTTTFQVEGHGPVKNPGLRGRIDFQNGSLALEDVPNGLSQLRGTLEFNQNRLEVRSLTAISGGGELSVGGYLAYQHGLYADLRVTGKGIRIRYPAGVSSLADGSFHLQGVQNSLLLSGNVLITRFSVSPDLDIAALAAQANGVKPVISPDAPSNHIRLDVHVTSSPQLNFQNTVAKLAGNVDLRLRGTVASPTLLGSVRITEGSALIAGTRYELQSGTVSFTNPVRIEPNVDLSATAHVSDYDITLGLHGTPEKLSVTYRSDPPLPEGDVVALLALGRTGEQQRLYTQPQEQAMSNPATEALLGGALNATVSSRVQKLFGAGSVKIDPNYIGALGNSTSRIIVEEQVGRNMTFTYATNVDTAQQQLLQAEIAINRHISLMVARDESGVFSMVIKATRRYR